MRLQKNIDDDWTLPGCHNIMVTGDNLQETFICPSSNNTEAIDIACIYKDNIVSHGLEDCTFTRTCTK